MLGRLKHGRAHAGAEILEIRIHGVYNAPPIDMLGGERTDLRREAGDDLGSFWRSTTAPPPSGIAAVEAFSWGAQARTGGGSLAGVGRAAVHVGWFFLLPYALANLAYWTRRIDAGTPSAGASQWDGGRGAATVRVFGLLLTLIAVAAFASVAIDLVAIQCFPAGAQLCAALPAPFEGLRTLDRFPRMALMGAVPILIVFALYLIGRRSRVRFEQKVQSFAAGLGDSGTVTERRGASETGAGAERGAPSAEPGRPLLATRGFWAVSRAAQTSERVHLAASVALVVFILALDAAYADRVDCFASSAASLEWGCVASSTDDPVPLWFGLGALAVILICVWLISKASRSESDASTRRKRLGALLCLLVAAAAYAAWTILTFTPVLDRAENPDKGVLGLVVTPIALVVIALFLALAGVGWHATSRVRRGAGVALLVIGAALLLVSHGDLDGESRGEQVMVAADGAGWLLLGGAALCIALHLVIAWTAPGSHPHEAWRGQGAAVAMLLSLFAAMALSSLLVLGVASWLGAPADTGDTVRNLRTPADAAQPWNIPDAYERFAVVLLAIAVLMALLLAVVAVVGLTRFVALTLPRLRPLPEEYGSDAAWAAASGGILHADPRVYPCPLKPEDGRQRRLAQTRRTSHMLHRGEPLFGWLAVFAAVGFLALSSNTVFIVLRAAAAQIDPALPSGIRFVSTSVLVLIAVAALAAVAAPAASSPDRPLGVFWDIVAFLPRAGHPLAPPCYGERVVPELAARTRVWLESPAARGPRGVIYAAHSMGSTVAAATLFALRGEEIEAGPHADAAVVSRMAMLSFGSQLRAYFSRFFPSVFGPHVLGVPGTVGPSLWSADPWARQVRAEFASRRPVFAGPEGVDALTLTSVLGGGGGAMPRWRSLWRRTDYLGFPVHGYLMDDNPVDRGAPEDAPDSYLWRVATHDGRDYLESAQYAACRDELARSLGADAERPSARERPRYRSDASGTGA